MAMQTPGGKKVVEKILDDADIRIDGNRPWDIQVHNPEFYDRILAGGSLALGESYMDGWWDCDALDQFFDKILSARLDDRARKSLTVLLAAIRSRLINRQRRSRAFEIGKRHYDIGNDLFQIMLDTRMCYSCGCWNRAATLDGAQEEKLDLICRKIELAPGMKVLDIGCGWGSFVKYAAESWEADVVGITVSEEQARLARERCQGLPVRIELMDYRQLDGTFDRIVSVGMFEHVGAKNYRRFMKAVHDRLKPGGLFLLQTIAGNRTFAEVDPWINAYIFPNSLLPSARQITAAAEGLFVLEDWHSFGHYYDQTLMAWYRNFKANWNAIAHKFDQRFYRMWTYYLLSCAGSFRARRNQLWQIVLSKEGVRGGYHRIG
jgi:cyclopropane-fatty-acyl-phospholipid synthase